LTVILTVQPDVIVDLASRKAFRGRGFLARWLYSLPKSRVGYRNVDAPPVPEESRQMWNALLRAILSLPIPQDGALPMICLSSEAHALLRTFRQEVEVELREGEALDTLADWGNKLPGNVARLAGLLHIAQWAMNKVCKFPWDTEITPETMESAISLGRYFEGHAQAAFALMGSDGEIAIAKKTWASVQKQNTDQFTVRDLHQRVRRQFKTVSGLESALNTLEEMGYVRRLETPKPEGRGKAPSPMFLVNPLARTSKYGRRRDLEVF
jgi:replicative DNA helicase